MGIEDLMKAHNPKILSIIKDFEANRYQSVYNALVKLVEENEPEQFEKMINAQYGKSSYKKLLLNIAVRSEDIDIIKLLLLNKADPLQCDSHGWSALSLAKKSDKTEILKLLEKSHMAMTKDTPQPPLPKKRKTEATRDLLPQRHASKKETEVTEDLLEQLLPASKKETTIGKDRDQQLPLKKRKMNAEFLSLFNNTQTKYTQQTTHAERKNLTPEKGQTIDVFSQFLKC